jgi:recombination protein RecR
VIAVVSSPLDVFALEKAGYKGLYHVLHGVIDPLNNIGPDELYVADLLGRLNSNINEIILATNTSMEGESTAMYLTKLIRDAGYFPDTLRITRLARGLPVGGDIEYADDITLSRALEGRSSV